MKPRYGTFSNFLKMTYFYLMYIGILPMCVCQCEGVRSPDTGVTDSCERSCGC